MDRRRSFRSVLPRLVVASLILLGAALWSGCTTDRRYKVLSFFFDGVPDPAEQARLAAAMAAGGNVGGRTADGRPILYFSHKPYEQQQCGSCHSGQGALFRPDAVDISSSVCLKCHTNVIDRFPVMHGPVAAVECLWCHAPHEADNKALLKEHSPGVCLQCHSRELLDSKPPEHQQANASCLDCHSAHGGEKHGLLRPTYLEKPSSPTTTLSDPAGGRS